MILFLVLVPLAVAVGVEFGVYYAFLTSDLPGLAKVVFVGLVTVCLIGSFVQPYRRTREAERRRRDGDPLRPDYRKNRTRGAGGGALGAMAYGGVGLAQGFFALAVVLGFGWFVFMLFFALQREYGVEHDARLRYEGKA
ncbi:hypothetical protein [Motilibacter peucedani]|uniref:hypothetical protein n=1 Tax=Motilibacter peucedani TaxID=598650 RepID=UPI0011C375A6|nr:hypothetical protein [Motilibacter peucedani]